MSSAGARPTGGHPGGEVPQAEVENNTFISIHPLTPASGDSMASSIISENNNVNYLLES
ncbi:MAG TPA: hypothetical protein VGD22_18395 [Sphingobacteriaceae bacterium]